MSAASQPQAALELDVFACPLDGVNQIEASAGTGKTWNICALYVRLLLEKDLGADEILVVTFTKAATAELHERIRGRLAQLAHALDTGDDAFRLAERLAAAEAAAQQAPFFQRAEEVVDEVVIRLAAHRIVEHEFDVEAVLTEFADAQLLALAGIQAPQAAGRTGVAFH